MFLNWKHLCSQLAILPMFFLRCTFVVIHEHFCCCGCCCCCCYCCCCLVILLIENRNKPSGWNSIWNWPYAAALWLSVNVCCYNFVVVFIFFFFFSSFAFVFFFFCCIYFRLYPSPGCSSCSCCNNYYFPQKKHSFTSRKIILKIAFEL